MTLITADQLDFSHENSSAVISGAQKFIIPIPPLPNGGEPLVYPASHEKAGQPITDWEGNPIGDRGIVFFNAKDQSYQAVKGDGTGVVIINQVTDSQSYAIHNTLVMNDAFSQSGVETENLKKALIAIATPKDQGGAGFDDMYNSDRAFVDKKMTRVDDPERAMAHYGLHKRDDRDICKAVYLRGEGEFQGAAATPQKFKNGAVIVKQGDDVRLVQADIFKETYLQANGQKINLASLKEQRVVPDMSKLKGGTQEIASPEKGQNRVAGL